MGLESTRVVRWAKPSPTSMAQGTALGLLLVRHWVSAPALGSDNSLMERTPTLRMENPQLDPLDTMDPMDPMDTMDITMRLCHEASRIDRINRINRIDRIDRGRSPGRRGPPSTRGTTSDRGVDGLRMFTSRQQRSPLRYHRIVWLGTVLATEVLHHPL